MIPWLPILTVGSTLLGSLFGNNDSSYSKETQSQNSNTTSITGGSTKLTGTQDTAQQQNQTSVQQNSQVSGETGATAATTAANVSRLDSGTLEQLTTQVQSLLAGTGKGSSALGTRLDEVAASGDDFDVDSYVSGVMGAATDTIGSSMESDIAKLEAGSGASRRSNSNTALLAGKLRSSAAAQLGGVKADAQAKGAELARARQESKTGQISSLAAGTDTTAINLLGSLLQASESQTGQQTGTSTTAGTTSGTTTGATNTTTVESSDTTQEQAQAGTSTQTTQTTGTGKKKSSSNSGGGLGGIFDTIADVLGAIF